MAYLTLAAQDERVHQWAPTARFLTSRADAGAALASAELYGTDAISREAAAMASTRRLGACMALAVPLAEFYDPESDSWTPTEAAPIAGWGRTGPINP